VLCWWASVQLELDDAGAHIITTTTKNKLLGLLSAGLADDAVFLSAEQAATEVGSLLPTVCMSLRSSPQPAPLPVLSPHQSCCALVWVSMVSKLSCKRKTCALRSTGVPTFPPSTSPCAAFTPWMLAHACWSWNFGVNKSLVRVLCHTWFTPTLRSLYLAFAVTQ